MVGDSSSPAAQTKRTPFVSLYIPIILGNHAWTTCNWILICNWIVVLFIDQSVNALLNPYLIDPAKLFLTQLAGAKYIKQRAGRNFIFARTLCYMTLLKLRIPIGATSHRI
jgi:hypothetical protein